jgi:hypothetical protein
LDRRVEDIEDAEGCPPEHRGIELRSIRPIGI